MKLNVKLLENKKLADDFILNIHYAKRKPSISYVYGLFDKGELIGICSYGMPPSPILAESIIGKKDKKLVIELNRLVLKYNRKNEASYLVGKSIKLLPKPKIIVSFADENQNHKGIIYQATNFIYTGITQNNYQYVDKNNKEFHFRKLGHLQKNNKLGVGLVKKRINEKELNRIVIATYLRNNKGKFTAKQLDELFGYKDTAAHWFRLDKGFSYPNVDDWIKLKNILGFDNTYDNLMTQYEMTADRKEMIKQLKLKKVKIKGKHRYIYIHANKKQKLQLLSNLKYSIMEYPKNDISGHRIQEASES